MALAKMKDRNIAVELWHVGDEESQPGDEVRSRYGGPNGPRAAKRPRKGFLRIS